MPTTRDLILNSPINEALILINRLRAAAHTEKLENRRFQKIHATTKAKKSLNLKEHQNYTKRKEKLDSQLEDLEQTVISPSRTPTYTFKHRRHNY